MVGVLGITFSELTEHQVVASCCAWAEDGTPHHIVTAGPELVMRAIHDEKIRRVLEKADAVTPDGIGIVIASRWYGKPVAERVTGVDLMFRLLAYAAHAGKRVYMLGASPASSQKALAVLEEQYPGLMIAGEHGYFAEDQVPAIIEKIQAFAPDFLFVGLGQPRQELFIAEHQALLRVPLAMGVGGSIDIVSGMVPRAPGLFRKLHLEWLYRLLREPHRFRRQLVLPQFAWYAWRDARRGHKEPTH